MTDTLLKSTAMDILVKSLGIVETERFIALMLKEPFDYTAWRQTNLPGDIPIEELSRQAMDHWKKTYPEGA